MKDHEIDNEKSPCDDQGGLPENPMEIEPKSTENASEEMLSVFVRLPSHKRAVVQVPAFARVLDLKNAIALAAHIAAPIQKLIYASHVLVDNELLSHFGMKDSCTVLLIIISNFQVISDFVASEAAVVAETTKKKMVETARRRTQLKRAFGIKEIMVSSSTSKSSIEAADTRLAQNTSIITRSTQSNGNRDRLLCAIANYFVAQMLVYFQQESLYKQTLTNVIFEPIEERNSSRSMRLLKTPLGQLKIKVESALERLLLFENNTAAKKLKLDGSDQSKVDNSQELMLNPISNAPASAAQRHPRSTGDSKACHSGILRTVDAGSSAERDSSGPDADILLDVFAYKNLTLFASKQKNLVDSSAALDKIAIKNKSFPNGILYMRVSILPSSLQLTSGDRILTIDGKTPIPLEGSPKKLRIILPPQLCEEEYLVHDFVKVIDWWDVKKHIGDVSTILRKRASRPGYLSRLFLWHIRTGASLSNCFIFDKPFQVVARSKKPLKYNASLEISNKNFLATLVPGKYHTVDTHDRRSDILYRQYFFKNLRRMIGQPQYLDVIVTDGIANYQAMLFTGMWTANPNELNNRSCCASYFGKRKMGPRMN